MEFKGTKGPWRIQLDSFNEFNGVTTHKIKGGINKTVAKIYATHKEEFEANAQLIAAAPENLQTLIDEVDFLNSVLNDGLQMQDAHRSTIKARVIVLKKQINKALGK